MNRSHFTVDRRPRNQFRSRFEGHNKAQRVWTCKACRRQHAIKPAFCAACPSGDFWYFQSQKEADRFASLALWCDHGIILELEVHPKFALCAPRWVKDPADPKFEIIEETTVGHYVADFRYLRDGKRIVEDVKAKEHAEALDPLFRWKRRHVEAQYGIQIETYS